MSLAARQAQLLGRFLTAASSQCGAPGWSATGLVQACRGSAGSVPISGFLGLQPLLRAMASDANGQQQPLSLSNHLNTQTPVTTSTTASSSSSSSSSLVDADGFQLKYTGFFARPHKRLKYASLLNTFASLAAAPLIVTYSPASSLVRVAVSVSVLAFAIITTGGLHWFTSPYVHQLMYNVKTDTAKVQTLGLLGGSRWHEFPVSAVQAPTGYHPLASFKVKGRTLYLDKANFEDTDLLSRLVHDSVNDDDNTSAGSNTALPGRSGSSSSNSSGLELRQQQ